MLCLDFQWEVQFRSTFNGTAIRDEPGFPAQFERRRFVRFVTSFVTVFKCRGRSLTRNWGPVFRTQFRSTKQAQKGHVRASGFERRISAEFPCPKQPAQASKSFPDFGKIQVRFIPVNPRPVFRATTSGDSRPRKRPGRAFFRLCSSIWWENWRSRRGRRPIAW